MTATTSVIRRSGSMYSIVAPSGLHWANINPKQLGANDVLFIAARLDMTFDQIGKAIAVMYAKDQVDAAEKYGIKFSLALK